MMLPDKLYGVELFGAALFVIWGFMAMLMVTGFKFKLPTLAEIFTLDFILPIKSNTPKP